MTRIWTFLFVVVIIGGVGTSQAWLSSVSPLTATTLSGAHHHDRCIRGTTSSSTIRQWATVKDNQQQQRSETSTTTKPSLDETTQKYGLEVGLLQSLFAKKEENNNDGGAESAKSLLKRYGIAYLATSIPLAIVSFAICYYLVDQGVNVSQLLNQVGIINSQSAESSSTVETAGTLAIAYAAHKAASPIRFPPTVILTPIVAKWLGKEPQEEGEEAK